jgi:hypothetical protein
MNKAFQLFCSLALILFSACSKDKLPVFPDKLTSNFAECPMNTGSEGPMFSWQLISTLRNQSQSAYRILVSDNQEDLISDTGNIWDSGISTSSRSILVEYAGPELKPAQTYFWKVKVWNQDGVECGWSKVATFHTALFSQADWKNARWIGFEEMVEANRLVPGVHGNGDHLDKQAIQRPVIPFFRKDFKVTKQIAKAILYISGLGQYEASINGQQAGEGFLTPGWTDYEMSVLYNVLDVTGSVHQGSNTIGVLVGNGFFNINRERYRKLVIAYGMPRMICLLKLVYADGSSGEIISDDSWKTAPSPVTYTSIFGGEDYDARLEQDGWNKPGFDDTSWKNAVFIQSPTGELMVEDDHPLKVMETFVPVKVVNPRPGKYLYDFGQNASGIIEIKVQGKKGHEVRLIPAELVTPDNLANQSASGSPFYFSYILKGDGVETWRPRFTYYGFRYLQVEGAVPDTLPGMTSDARIVDLKLLHTRNSTPDAGSFTCSFDLFNQINELIRWGIKSNLQSVLTDCPHREKLGWLEQTYLMGGSVHFNFNLFQLYAKQVNDMMEAQTEDGLVPDIAPEYVPFEGGFRDSPEWGSAAVILPWLIYTWYGDKSVMERAWPMMIRYVRYLETKSKNDLLSHGLGDWFDLGPGSPGPSQLTPSGLTATAIYYYDLNLLTRMADILQKDQERLTLSAWAERVKTAFNGKYLNRETGVYSTGSQTAMSMPLCVGLVDDDIYDKVLHNLEDAIVAGKKALTAGDIGFHFLVEALTNGGKSQLLYEMNAPDDVPGYGFQLKKGATALTESWPALEIVSNNHLMLGHLMEWFYAGLCGINQSDSSAGYKEIVIKPCIVDGILHAQASYQSPYGPISCAWEKQIKGILVNILIPVNTTACVVLPAGAGSTVTEGKNIVGTDPQIQILKRDEEKLVCQIGSGRYVFRIDE